MLQWGRNFFVTEIFMKLWKEKYGTTLQWGRNFFVTEIMYLDGMYVIATTSFNGAVTFSLRKSALSGLMSIPYK